jgi:hypothetical protein
VRTHNVQHMPVRGAASRATARKLIASSNLGPAKIIVERTIECNDYDPAITVVPCKSKQDQTKCTVLLAKDQRYFMVRSERFPARWYVLTKDTGIWVCSLRDVLDRCTAQVETFIATRRAA